MSINGFNDHDAQVLIGMIESAGGQSVVGGRRQISGPLKHVYPPAGGIPAATWSAATEQMTPGKGTCRLAVKVGGAYEPTEATIDVENPVGGSVGASGKPMTIGRLDGEWTVLVEDCTSSTSGPVASNTQAGKLNLNYKLGVGLGV